MLNILLAVDGPTLGAIVEDRLRPLGHRICARPANGNELLDQVRRLRPALAIIESGFARRGEHLARQVRKLGTPVICLADSAWRRPRLADALLYLGPDSSTESYDLAIATVFFEAEPSPLRGASTLPEVTSDGVIITDVAGRIWLVNGPAEHITGWTAAEAAGQPLGSVFKTVYEEAAGPDRITLVRRDGTRRAIPGGSAVPLRDDTGAPIGAVLCFHAARPALSRVLELMRPVQIVAESA